MFLFFLIKANVDCVCKESNDLKRKNLTDRWRAYSVDGRGWRAKDWKGRWRGEKDGGADERACRIQTGFFPSGAFALMAPAEARKHSLD